MPTRAETLPKGQPKMQKNISHTSENIMKERFGKDSLIALATVSDGKPYVRAVNSYYEDGCFYVITYELSNKMRHIRENPIIGICGEWFTAQGVGESLGYICANENKRGRRTAGARQRACGKAQKSVFRVVL